MWKIKESSIRFSQNHEKATIYCCASGHLTLIESMCRITDRCVPVWFIWSHFKCFLMFIIFFHHEPADCSRESLLRLSFDFLSVTSFCPPYENQSAFNSLVCDFLFPSLCWQSYKLKYEKSLTLNQIILNNLTHAEIASKCISISKKIMGCGKISSDHHLCIDMLNSCKYIIIVLDRLTLILYKISIPTKSIKLGYVLPVSELWHFIPMTRFTFFSTKTNVSHRPK